MEDKELQKIWRSADSEIHLRSREEINLLLNSVTRQTMNKFLLVLGFGILSSAGLLVFLTVASIGRYSDVLFLINNTLLGLIAMIGLISALASWVRLQRRNYYQSLRSWLEEKITYLRKMVRGKSQKIYVIIMPVIYILTVLAIHVYYENKPFLEVLQTEESVIGLIVGAPIGLLAAFLAGRKIHKNQLANLEFLEDLHNRLTKDD